MPNSKIIQFRTGNPSTVITCTNPADTALTERLRSVGGEHGVELLVASDLQKIGEYLASNPRQPLVLGFSGFGPEAAAFLESVRIMSPDAPVVVVLDQDSAKDAVRFIRWGVFECLGPAASTDDIFNVLQAALVHGAERRTSEAGLATEPWRRRLVGQSAALEAVAKVIGLVAPRRCTVLISGETGTGKEMAARAIHQAGDRSRRPMISVNCSALPENLIETELFGHVKGAFTGAVGNRIGRFEQAEGGTLFLDEIGDFPIHLQAKLLRVLQERELQRVGGTETLKVDVRVIAATNADLLTKVKQGLFREDLYYRLNVIPLRMPALRDRITDIPLLVNHFVRKVCASEGLSPKSVSSCAINKACEYSWPGNVRQLENIVEQAVVMNAYRESLDASCFSFPARAQEERAESISLPAGNLPDEGMDFAEILRQFERGILDQALVRSQGNKTLAAEMLRLPRTTLVNKLRALELAA